MKNLARVCLLYALAAAARFDPQVPYDFQRYLAVLRLFASQPPYTFVSTVSMVNAVPKALRPDVLITTSFRGEPFRYTTLPAPNPALGHRSVGAAFDAMPPFALVVGDSYTEAQQVSDEQTYPALLSARTGHRFVNLGVGAQGLVGHLERLRHSGFLDARPKLIVLQLCANDFAEDVMAQGALAAARPNDLLYHDEGSAARKAIVGFWTRNPALYVASRRVLATPASFAKAASPVEERLLRRLLVEFERVARRAGARLLVYSVDPRQTAAAREVLPADTAVLDMRQGHSYRYDGHWTPRGHEEVAGRLLEELWTRGWLENR